MLIVSFLSFLDRKRRVILKEMSIIPLHLSQYTQHL